uniref:Perilipin-3-like n=1 Tax=Petromyzon marinus TaxID=7757 RepID=A0AAJ7U8I9_PETMA|nr:perilipin-3-like [Petromyzon marinus]
MAEYVEQQCEASVEAPQSHAVDPHVSTTTEGEGVVARLHRVPLVASLLNRVGGTYGAVRAWGGVVGATCKVAETGFYVATSVASTSVWPVAWALKPQLAMAGCLVVKGVDFLETKLPSLLHSSNHEVVESGEIPAASSALGSVAGAIASVLSGTVSASRSLLGSRLGQLGPMLMSGVDCVLCRTEEYIGCYLKGRGHDDGKAPEAEAAYPRKDSHPVVRVALLAGRVTRGLYDLCARRASDIHNSCVGFEQQEPSDADSQKRTIKIPLLLSKALVPVSWLTRRSLAVAKSMCTAVVNRAYDHAINNSSLNWVMRTLGLCKASPCRLDAREDRDVAEGLRLASDDGGAAQGEGQGHPQALRETGSQGGRLAPIAQDPDCFPLQPGWQQHHHHLQQPHSPDGAF